MSLPQKYDRDEAIRRLEAARQLLNQLELAVTLREDPMRATPRPPPILVMLASKSNIENLRREIEASLRNELFKKHNESSQTLQ